jgi:hypothetical protein
LHGLRVLVNFVLMLINSNTMVLVLYLCLFFNAAASLPELNTIVHVKTGLPYGCPGASMASSCVSFSTDTPSADNCDILLNGGCNTGALYWQVNLAGTSFGMITDVGEVPLETLTSSKTMNYDGISGRDNTFKATQLVKANHTYAFILARATKRAVLELRVLTASDKGMSAEAAVRLYEIHSVTEESKGFSWDNNNTAGTPPGPPPAPAPSRCGQSCSTNADCPSNSSCPHCENLILGQCVTG